MKIIRRLYDWVLSWAETRFGTPALGVMSFCESSFFPIPPDVLQIALSVSKPLRSFWYATVSLIGSVLGALLGYLIGYVFWELTKDFFFNYVFSEEIFNKVGELYAENAFLVIFTAAFTPIPYKACTVAAGFWEISLLTLILASIAGRGLRFYSVAALMYFFGPTVKIWIDRHFNWMTIIFTILVIVGVVMLKVVL
ncbi:MAG: DedA family protein [Planctomycetaceae bacterium]|nr:DedA family protein [Planctomycetaceae bacterium]